MGWPNFIFEKLFEEVFSHSLGPEQKLDRSPSALRLEEKRGAFARDRVGPDSSAVARHDAFDDAQAPDGHRKLLHLWPVKLLQAGRSDYDYVGVMAMREAASFRR